MKHLLNKSTQNKKGRIPLFFELRAIKFDGDEPLEETLFSVLTNKGAKEGRDLFISALEHGIFAIFLDGFDEIRPEFKERALIKIDDFSKRFDNISILISSRPKTGVHSLEDFITYHINPLTKEQAVSVVEKTTFDDQTKEKFLSALNGGLY